VTTPRERLGEGDTDLSLNAFLEENPDILFEAQRPQATRPGIGANFLNYWRRHQGDVWSDYLGRFGQTALEGVEPTQGYTSFIKSYPWEDYWKRLSPSQRGEGRGSQGSRLRWDL
jgi:hypothetical protein